MLKPLLLLLLTFSLAAPSWADDPVKDFASGQADVIKVAVAKLQGDSLVPIRADETFHQGDSLRVSLESNFPGYVYIVNQQPGGKTVVLLPSSAHPQGTLVAGQSRMFPEPPDALVFDAAKGIESLKVVMAHDKVPAYDAAIANQGVLSGSDPYPSPTGRSMAGHAGVVAVSRPPGPHLGFRALYVGRPEDTTASYVSVVKEDGTGGHLQPSEAGVFEIHLRHQ